MERTWDIYLPSIIAKPFSMRQARIFLVMFAFAMTSPDMFLYMKASQKWFFTQINQITDEMVLFKETHLFLITKPFIVTFLAMFALAMASPDMHRLVESDSEVILKKPTYLLSQNPLLSHSPGHF